MERNGAYKPEPDLPEPDLPEPDLPEPDLAVVAYDDVVGGKRFADAAILLAEVVSSTDEDLTPVSGARWIDVKVRLYREHGPCRTILVVEQERVHVTLHAREAGGWTCRMLTGLDDDLAIHATGLACKVGDLYRDTRWQPRRVRTAPNQTG